MNEEIKVVPSHILEKWEKEAIAQGIPYTEFGGFLRMKEESYWQSMSTKEVRAEIFANDARNKLTDHGQRVALETLLSIPMVERCCKFARFDFEDMKERLSKGFATIEQKEMFLMERDHWFLRLKEKMKDFRISKETLQGFGLNWNECKSFAYQTI